MAAPPPLPRLSELQRFIVREVGRHPDDIAKLVSERFQISRQAANRHLRRLVDLGALHGEGATRSRRYRLPVLREQRVLLPIGPHLQEDVVWRDHVAPLMAGIRQNVVDICHYGLTEIVNNAIDHSASPEVGIETKVTATSVSMMVVDEGVGIFRKIREAYGLEDDRHAILELVKGKLTTDPERHTGEGIFFTSRAFDEFGILSGDLWLGHHREGGDWLIQDRTHPASGTSVHMEIDLESDHTLTEVFDRYATEHDDYTFRRTHVLVALAQFGAEALVSRSQARRLMARLERFREVVLDFSGVPSIGPAFADEIFRVVAAQHPDVTITPTEMNESVAKMVRRALAASVPSPAGDARVVDKGTGSA